MWEVVLSLGPRAVLIPPSFAAGFSVSLFGPVTLPTFCMPGSKPALLTWGGWVRGLREQKQQWEGHFSRPGRRDTRSVSEQWSVAWMGAANGIEGPRDLGPHREVWFLRL